MFFKYEQKRYRQELSQYFNDEEITAIINQALIDLKNRNITGVLIVPLAYLVGGFATDYASQHQFLYSFLGTLLVIAMMLRTVTIRSFSKNTDSENSVRIPVFFWSNLLVAVVWGLFSGTAVLFYHDSLSITLIIILLAGISGGSIASYCIWKLLCYSYLLTILLPAVVVEFYVGNSVTIPVGVAISFFLVFNLVQAKLWYKHYWASIINTFLVKKNALELSKLNTKLTNEIADHKETAKKIAISRKKLEDIYNSAHDGILIFALNGEVIDTNNTMLEMFDVSRDTALQFNIHHCFDSKSNRDIDLQSIWHKALDGKDQEFRWNTYIQNDDSISTVQVNLRKSLWGEDYIIIATIRDITLQVEAMEATIAANHAKSEFLANMSHELRTPMHGVLGYARLGMKRSETLPREKLNEYFFIIRESGLRLMRMLNNVLDFSKLEVGKMRYNMNRNDLLPRIHQVITEFTPNADEKNLHFALDCQQNKVVTYCDHEKISQVLRNLLFNAVKFSYEDTTITISCHETTDHNGGQLQLFSVSNVGVLIPEKELNIIFEKFIQSSATNTGAGSTGLGLAISKQIILDHKGKIWAENGSENTVTFSFSLPMAENDI